MKADVAPRPIDLAEVAPFRIGDLDVRPAILEVIAADGAHETLEPRVMQVLVALYERRGEVVSRDTLNELCWGGRVVGDDALQRCISRLRKLGRDHAAFDVENVRGVGLRLAEAGGSGRPGILRRPWALGAVVVAVLVLALAGFAGWRALRSPSVKPAPSVAVGSFRVLGQDPAGRELAVRLADDVRGVLADNVYGASVKDETRGARADMTLGGAITRDGDVWRVRATLTDRSGVILWSREYARPVAEEARLRDQVIVGATESVVSTLEILRQPVKLDPETLALYVRSQELATTGDPTRPGASLQGLEQVMARAPTMGLARGTHAFRLTFQMDGAPPQERERLRLRAYQEANRAIRDSPHAGGAYDALYWLRRGDAPGDLAAAEDVLLRGLAAAPESYQIAMRECRFLGEVGRLKEAPPYCERAVALRPMGAPVGEPYATALYRAGSRDAAKQAIERAARFHPEHGITRSSRFNMRLADGDFDGALQLLRSPETRPFEFNAAVIQALELLIEARRSGTRQAADRAIAALRSAVKTDRMSRYYLVTGATRLGRLDDAFAALAAASDFNNDFPSVFGVGMAPLRKDPRFWGEAKRGGYLRYWRTRNIWPDFCQGPKAELDCPAAAARAGV